MARFSSDPGSSGDRPGRGKPRLWAGGGQRPGFDLRAFLRVSVANSRTVASPCLMAIAGRLYRFGLRVEDGAIRIPAARLGHTGKWLPTHVTTGRRLRDGAALTRIAAEAARGGAPVEPMDLRGWTDAPVPPAAPVAVQRPPEVVAVQAVPAERPALQRPKRPAPLPAAPTNAEGERDTLDVIRTLMSMEVIEPVHPPRGPKARAAPPTSPGGAGALPELAPAEPMPRSAPFRAAGQALGLISVGLALPVGMVQAALAIARGEDLRLVS